jgi:hypothetical protein
MSWQITSYPTLSASKKQAILDWIEANHVTYEQATNDTYTYGPATAFGDSTAAWKYAQALSTIARLKEEFRHPFRGRASAEW